MVAAIKGIISGVLVTYLDSFEKKTYNDPKLEELKAILIKGREEIQSAVGFAKSQNGVYIELIARRLVDAAIAVLTGHYLLGQATKNERKKHVAELFIVQNESAVTMKCVQVKQGCSKVIDDYELLAGSVPVA
ncbi:MAG: hypothetical protein LBE12_20650 [Planctomycetaceae bacterium]|nr:hypothetical protein [Planctomycetaceae bacterium]